MYFVEFFQWMFFILSEYSSLYSQILHLLTPSVHLSFKLIPKFTFEILALCTLCSKLSEHISELGSKSLTIRISEVIFLNKFMRKRTLRVQIAKIWEWEDLSCENAKSAHWENSTKYKKCILLILHYLHLFNKVIIEANYNDPYL